MSDKAISFKDPLVLAIERGEKTMTRRLAPTWPRWGPDGRPDDRLGGLYTAGDRLWVKQRLVRGVWGHEAIVRYGTSGDAALRDGAPVPWPWKPSILGAMYCPRWASRLTLEVLTVRVERLQDITEADAIAEGAQRFDDIPLDPVHERHPEHADRWSMDAAPPTTGHCLGTARFAFANLWDRINGKTPGAPGSAIGS